MSKFILRIRHNKGTTRFELTNKSSTTIKQVKQLISTQLTDHPPISSQQLTLNGKSTDNPFKNNATLSSLHINHGDMLYLKIITSAIICHSNNSRKRKRNETDSSNTLPPNKRQRLNTNNNNHNHNSSSLIVHTLSNTQNTTDSNHSNTSNITVSNPRINTKKKPSKKSSKKKKKKDEFLIIQSEGDTVYDIVQNYYSETNALQTVLNTLPKPLQSMYTKQARIEAILNDKVEITEHLESSRFTSKAKSRGKRFLIVMYSFKRKKRKETVCFYDDDKIEEIINGLLWETVDETEREKVFMHNKINHKNMMELIKKSKLKLIEMAHRSPALLWSLYHSFPNQDIENVLQKIVKSALKTLRIKTRELIQT